jgi:hypothetical protein
MKKNDSVYLRMAERDTTELKSISDVNVLHVTE